MCPALKVYSKEQQTKAADELDALPPGAVLGVMIDDYGEIRAQCRALK